MGSECEGLGSVEMVNSHIRISAESAISAVVYYTIYYMTNMAKSPQIKLIL